jgi:Uroporphyrinogen decarboxylase (URO-D)
MGKMTASERFNATLNFAPVDRLPIIEWAPYWNKTIERWENEGMPRGMDNEAIQRHFGLDVILQNWVRPVVHEIKSPSQHGGAIISNEQDYDEMLERGMFSLTSDKYRTFIKKWETWHHDRNRTDTITMLTLDGFFWFPRVLFGIEQHLFAFYDNPGLMHRINHDMCNFILQTIETICTIEKPDFMTLAEDMSYNNGPMLSEQLFDEFMLPYYDKVAPRLKELDIPLIVDSDGDITECAAWFQRAGADGILPLEKQAGVDINILQEKYPEMCWIGAYDKMVMNQGEAAIRTEFERLLPAAKQGGLIISCDHQTPPGVSLKQYQNYLHCFREYATH